MPRTTPEPQGCLAAILALFGIHLGPARAKELPYRQRDDFLSPAEFSLTAFLCGAVGDRGAARPKVQDSERHLLCRSAQRESGVSQ